MDGTSRHDGVLRDRGGSISRPGSGCLISADPAQDRQPIVHRGQVEVDRLVRAGGVLVQGVEQAAGAAPAAHPWESIVEHDNSTDIEQGLHGPEISLNALLGVVAIDERELDAGTVFVAVGSGEWVLVAVGSGTCVLLGVALGSGRWVGLGVQVASGEWVLPGVALGSGWCVGTGVQVASGEWVLVAVAVFSGVMLFLSSIFGRPPSR